MKKVLLAASVVLLLIFAVILTPRIRADDTNCNCKDLGCLDQLNTCLNNLNNALSMSVNATRPLESQLTSLQNQIAGIKASIANIEDDISVKREQIDKGYQDLAAKQLILNAKIRDLYIKNFFNSPLTLFLTSKTANDWTQRLAYQKAVADQDKLIITNIALSVDALQTQKTRLEQQETQLTSMKATLDDQSAKLDKVVSDAKAYQATLTAQIAQLSAKQQELIAQKLGSLNIPLYAYSTSGGCSSDISPSYKDPGFSGTKFGFFTYGVPNRVGLNQYGALGRAQAGENSDTILHAYYNFDGYQNYSGITIRVNDSNGYDSGNIIWSGSLEDYMQRIYEVPNEWGDQGGMEALKAQAIAARSYVLAETNNGAKSICANQHCQVFQTGVKGGHWADAVSQTPGQAMVQGGHPITAWFSSTHGGYVYSSGGDVGGASWTKSGQDTNGSVSSFSDLQSKAYDKGSPWFYCDWGGRSQYNNTAWITSSEMADIVNSILLVQNESSADPHILQTDKNDPNMWTESQVSQELSKYRTPFTSISTANVNADFGSGQTTRVYFTGDAGSVDFDSNTFRKYFNLRAKSNIQIVGPLFNIEIR